MQQPVEWWQVTDIAAVVAAGDRSWRITRDDIVTYDYGAEVEAVPQVSVQAERAFLELSWRPRPVSPPGSVSLRVMESGLGLGSGRSLQPLADELQRDNVEMESLRTLGSLEVPERCDAEAHRGTGERLCGGGRFVELPRFRRKALCRH